MTKLLTLSNRLLKNTKNKKYEHYPKDNFNWTHVSETKLLPTREDLLTLLPKNKVVAEIGVDEGDFTKKIIAVTRPSKIEIIDVWGSKRYNTEKEQYFEKRFSNEINAGQLEIHKGYSTERIKDFSDNYFDWVYLDTDHSYDTTKAELAQLNPKMKEGGIIAGHDYIVGNWNGGVRYGVIEAVREFCINENWRLIYLTTELEIPPSFAIQKM